MAKLPTKILKEVDQWGPIDAKILYASFWFLPTAGLAKKKTGIGWPELLGAFKNDRLTFFWAKSGMEHWGNKALRQWIIPSVKRKQLWQKYSKLVRRMEQLARLIGTADQIKTVRPLAEQWYQIMMDFWSITLVPEIANFAAPDYLRQQLMNVLPPDKIDHALEVLLAPERLSFHQQSELELLKIIAADKNRNISAVVLKTYAKKWHWVENSYYENKHLSAQDFLRQSKKYTRANLAQKIRHIQNYSNEVVNKKRALIKYYRLPSKVAQTAQAMAFSIWWQDHRKGLAWWAHTITEQLSHAARQHFKLSDDELMHYTAEEWRNLFKLNRLITPKALTQRKNFVLADVKNGSYNLRYGRDARQFVKQLSASATAGAHHEILRGTVASRGQGGKITGRVCILHSPRLAAKMQPGQILVAPMTSPDYIQAMRQAKAIITDVGGLMSHAAVVSRELGVPCIVGTKLATKIFKDGDMVELDLELGFAKKL